MRVDGPFFSPSSVLFPIPPYSLNATDLHRHLAQLLANTVTCARECVKRAGLTHDKPDAIYLTGGSSALRTFQETLQTEFAGVPLVEGDLFGGVASGLVYSRK